MTQSKDIIREKIINIFERVRDSSGESYPQGEIVWHLVANSKSYSSIHDSFRGKRKLSQFLKAIELEFSICFTLKDWESLKSLEELVNRVEKLITTPKSSITTINKILRTRPNDMLTILICVLSFPVVILFFKLWGLAAILFLIAPVSACAYLLFSDKREKMFYQAIKDKIKENKAVELTP